MTSGCWLSTGASCPDMLGGQKEPPVDGQYLEYLSFAQTKRRCSSFVSGREDWSAQSCSDCSLPLLFGLLLLCPMFSQPPLHRGHRGTGRAMRVPPVRKSTTLGAGFPLSLHRPNCRSTGSIFDLRRLNFPGCSRPKQPVP